MRLPEFERVKLKNSPIFEVVCQLRFPTILKIKNSPEEFQEKIRHAYPIYEQNNKMPFELPQEVESFFNSTIALNHIFLNEERSSTIALTTDFIAFTTNTYKDFEDFKNKLDEILLPFFEIYKPSYFTRVGLRYRNIINKKVFPFIKDLNFSNIIPNNIAPEFYDKELQSCVDICHFEKKITLKDKNSNQKANLHYIYDIVNGILPKKMNTPLEFKNEESYLFDIDCYIEDKIEDLENARIQFEQLKNNAYKLFRKSITEDIHKKFCDS